jgi:hypothetical protein
MRNVMFGRKPLLALAFQAVVGLVLVACEDGSTLEIRPRSSLTDSAGLAGIRMDVDGRTLTARDFEIGEVHLSVPDAGELVILVELDQAGRSAVQGSVRLQMAEDWEWGLDIFRTVRDPLETCMGCMGHVRLVLPEWAAAEEGESLWFVWGGKPKGSDVVY